MGTKTTIIFGCLIVVMVLSVGYELGQAQSGPGSLNIGTVSIGRVFSECKRNAEYKKQASDEQSKIMQELEVLSKEVAAAEAALKTFRPGSKDYLEQVESLLEKQAHLNARQEYIKQQRTFQYRQWTEQLYQEVLRTTKNLAKQKGLDLVFESTEPQFPISSDELMLAISTHKLLYSTGCVDLTGEVIAQLDKEYSESQK